MSSITQQGNRTNIRYKVKGASEFKRLNDADYEEWLEDYSLGELWKKNLLGVRSQ